MAAILVSIMLLMASIGLVYALVSWPDRRAHDTGLPRGLKRSPIPTEDEAGQVAALAPDRWPALGYMPRGTSFLFGARVVELLQDPQGKRLLQQPIHVAGRSFNLAEIVRDWGLELEQVDHLVLGLKLEQVLPPWFIIVVRTRQPYSAEQLRSHLKAQPIAHEGKKRLLRFQPSERSLPLVIWFGDEQTLVLGLDDAQVEAVPPRPLSDLGQLDPDVKALVRDHHPPSAPVWLAGHSSNWSKTLVGPLVARWSQQIRQPATDIPTIALWIDLNESIQMQADMGCKDVPSARRLEESLQTTASSPKVKRDVARTDRWVLLKMQGPSTLLESLLEK